jgi:hypothetical protein
MSNTIKPQTIDHDQPDGMLRLRTSFSAQQHTNADVILSEVEGSKPPSMARMPNGFSCPAVTIPPLPAVGRNDTARIVILSGVEGSKKANTKNVPTIAIPPLPAVGWNDKPIAI